MNPKRETNGFRDILSGVAKDNARVLAERARTANRLAKTLRGKARSSAYALKNKALAAFVNKFPEWSFIRRDDLHPYVVSITSPRLGLALHGPQELFLSFMEPAFARNEVSRTLACPKADRKEESGQ